MDYATERQAVDLLDRIAVAVERLAEWADRCEKVDAPKRFVTVEELDARIQVGSRLAALEAAVLELDKERGQE